MLHIYRATILNMSNLTLIFCTTLSFVIYCFDMFRP